MTAWMIFSPSLDSASALSLPRIIADISGGENVLRSPPTETSTWASPLEALAILYGTRFASSWTSSNFRPMKRLIEKTVFCALVTAWRFAAWPTRRSPLLVKATIDGVVRAPSEFSMTTGSPPSITATQELVVPRSIPKILAINTMISKGAPSRLADFGQGFSQFALKVYHELTKGRLCLVELCWT